MSSRMRLPICICIVVADVRLATESHQYTPPSANKKKASNLVSSLHLTYFMQGYGRCGTGAEYHA